MWAGLRAGCPGRLSGDVEEGAVGAARGAAWDSCSERGTRVGRSWLTHLCRDTPCGLAVTTCEQARAPQGQRLSRLVAQPESSKRAQELPQQQPATAR